MCKSTSRINMVTPTKSKQYYHRQNQGKNTHRYNDIFYFKKVRRFLSSLESCKKMFNLRKRTLGKNNFRKSKPEWRHNVKILKSGKNIHKVGNDTPYFKSIELFLSSLENIKSNSQFNFYLSTVSHNRYFIKAIDQNSFQSYKFYFCV